MFVDTMRALVVRAERGEVEYFRASPRLTPRRRLDETRAARAPVLRWKPQRDPVPQAAE